jgi:signal transduction histidine kinase
MEHSTPIHSSACLAHLVAELSAERDCLRLVERAHESLARELGAPWSVAQATGAWPLDGLHIAHDVPEHAPGLDAFDADTDHPVRVTKRGGAVSLHVQRVDATQVSLLYGVSATPEAQMLLHAAGSFLRARLDDLFEVDAARREQALLDRRISDLSLLFKGLDVALSSVKLPQVLRAFMTCVTAGDAIGFNRAFLFLLDQSHEELRGVLAVGPASSADAQRIWTRLADERPTLDETLRRALDETSGESPDRDSLAERVHEVRVPLDASYSVLAQAVLRADPSPIRFSRSEVHEPFAEEFDSDEFVVVPILGRERTIGVLVADNVYSGDPVDDERIELLSGLASHVGVIIENVLMFDDVSRRYAELNEVQSINRALLSSTDFVEVLGRIAQISASMLQADGSLLFVADETSPDLRLEMQFHASGTVLSDASIRRCTGIAMDALRASASVGQRTGLDSDDDAALDLVSAPMRIDNEVAGVLVVYRRAGDEGAHTFDEHSRRFVSIIADQAAIALLSGRRLQTIRDDQRRIHSLNDLLYRNEKLAALGEAASMIAHEIRNPLTALGGFARRMLRSSNLQRRDRQAAQVIADEAGRLERILNDQLAFVRSARLERSAMSLNDLVRECHTLLREQLVDGGAELELELDPDIPDIALDADRMKQVLVNLLMNAIQVVRGSGRIRISTRRSGTSIELDVANTGPPIARARRATLFEPFATTRQDGTGLGLAVVYQIVTEHDGGIEVLSGREWGTIFRIRLGVAGAQPAGQTRPPPHGS